MKPISRYLAALMLPIFIFNTAIPAGYSGVVSPSSPIEIPENLGKIESHFEGTSPLKVILLQDAHANPDAQKSIRKLVEHFSQSQNIQLVGVEGATTSLDASLLRTFPDSEEVQKLIENLESKGEISGVVSSAVLNSKQIDYVGVDNEALYQQALEDYSAAQKENVFKKQLLEIEDGLTNIKKRLFDPKLFELDQKWNQFQSNPDKEIESFLKFCFSQQKPDEQHKALYSLNKDFEQKESKGAFPREISEIENEILKWITLKTDRMKFSEKQQAFKTGILDFSGYSFFLLELVDRYQVVNVNRNFLERHSELESLRVKARSSQFEDELNDYFKTLKKPFLRSVPIQIADDLTDRLNLLKKLSRLELSASDWEAFNQERPRFQKSAFISFLKSQSRSVQTESNLLIRMGTSHSGGFPWDSAISFYEVNKKRDQILIANLISRMTQAKVHSGILVSGGFHRQGIEDWLQKKNISYVSVCPHIGFLPEGNIYQQLMAGRISWSSNENIPDPYKEFQGFIIRKLFQTVNLEKRRDYLRLWTDELERTSRWKRDNRNNSRLLYQNYWQILSQAEQSRLESGFQNRLRQLNLDDRTLRQVTLPLALSSTIPSLSVRILQRVDDQLNPGNDSFRSELRAKGRNVPNLVSDAQQKLDKWVNPSLSTEPLTAYFGVGWIDVEDLIAWKDLDLNRQNALLTKSLLWALGEHRGASRNVLRGAREDVVRIIELAQELVLRDLRHDEDPSSGNERVEEDYMWAYSGVEFAIKFFEHRVRELLLLGVSPNPRGYLLIRDILIAQEFYLNDLYLDDKSLEQIKRIINKLILVVFSPDTSSELIEAVEALYPIYGFLSWVQTSEATRADEELIGLYRLFESLRADSSVPGFEVLSLGVNLQSGKGSGLSIDPDAIVAFNGATFLVELKLTFGKYSLSDLFNGKDVRSQQKRYAEFTGSSGVIYPASLLDHLGTERLANPTKILMGIDGTVVYGEAGQLIQKDGTVRRLDALSYFEGKFGYTRDNVDVEVIHGPHRLKNGNPYAWGGEGLRRLNRTRERRTPAIDETVKWLNNAYSGLNSKDIELVKEYFQITWLHGQYVSTDNLTSTLRAVYEAGSRDLVPNAEALLKKATELISQDAYRRSKAKERRYNSKLLVNRFFKLLEGSSLALDSEVQDKLTSVFENPAHDFDQKVFLVKEVIQALFSPFVPLEFVDAFVEFGDVEGFFDSRKWSFEAFPEFSSTVIAIHELLEVMREKDSSIHVVSINRLPAGLKGAIPDAIFSNGQGEHYLVSVIQPSKSGVSLQRALTTKGQTLERYLEFASRQQALGNKFSVAVGVGQNYVYGPPTNEQYSVYELEQDVLDRAVWSSLRLEQKPETLTVYAIPDGLDAPRSNPDALNESEFARFQKQLNSEWSLFLKAAVDSGEIPELRSKDNLIVWWYELFKIISPQELGKDDLNGVWSRISDYFGYDQLISSEAARKLDGALRWAVEQLRPGASIVDIINQAKVIINFNYRSEIRSCAIAELMGNPRVVDALTVNSNYFLENSLNVSVLWRKIQQKIGEPAELSKVQGVVVLDADLIPDDVEGQEALIHSLPDVRIFIADSKLNRSVSRDDLVNGFLELFKRFGKTAQKLEKNGMNIQTKTVLDKFSDDAGVILSTKDIQGDKNPSKFESFEIDQEVLGLLGTAAATEVLTRIALSPVEIREKYLAALDLARRDDGTIFVGVKFINALEKILVARESISASA